MTDEPMTDEPMPDEFNYDEWIAHRRAGEPSSELTDRVMSVVEARSVNVNRSVRLAERIDRSRAARWAACLAALLIGSLPFLIVAFVSKLIVF